jgi:holo-[acyl-carrier protein] synthase
MLNNPLSNLITVGTDIVFIQKIRKLLETYGEKFQNRNFTPKEIYYCSSKLKPYVHFAGKFAAKEAVAKALGVTRQYWFSWREIEILNESTGGPYVALHGVPQSVAKDCRYEKIDVSISHSTDYAIAVALGLKKADVGT